MTQTASLLIELLTEELPPKALQQLGQVFAESLLASLSNDGFVAASARHEIYASPRRLGVLIAEVRAQATDRQVLAKGPSVKSALDEIGRAHV